MWEHAENEEEAYIWALKNRLLSADETDDGNKRRSSPVKRPRTKETVEITKEIQDDTDIRTMASLVPDEIIYNIGDYSKRNFGGCLLFGDVSGFTDLCEKYNKTGKGGPSKLTQVLNNYIGAMVQEILSNNGDVLKFSGDAFIALWKAGENLAMKDAVREGLNSALVIQKSYGTYQTDVDVIVRVKLAISCGDMIFSLLGNEKDSHYLMTGEAISAIKVAESKSSAGEIIVTSKVLKHITANEYITVLLSDGLHAKVMGIGPNWRSLQRHYDDKDKLSIVSGTDEDGLYFKTTSLGSIVPADLGDTEEGDGTDEGYVATYNVTDQYALRPAVNYAARRKFKEELRRFIIGPVMRGIDAAEPLEYLTEIRQVVILFINCKLLSFLTPYQGIDVSNEIYIIVCKEVMGRYGCVNKISNFDKDTMLLVIFGLRGFKHELESQIALKCAKECYFKIQNLEHVEEVSVGISTGKTYCGAFGHSLRREYTVIGLNVNKAARLMVAYPNKVTCDRDTFLHSKLEARNFILQEYRHLKGIINPGPIYEFKEVEGVKYTGLYVNPLPLLGRDQEIDLYETLLNRAKSFRENKELTSKEPLVNMLIIQGVFRQGKTRLLEELAYITDNAIPINILSLSKVDYEVPYSSIRSVFSQFLGPNDSTVEGRTKTLGFCLRKTNLDNFFCTLNRIFGVNFPISEEYERMEASVRNRVHKEVYVALCILCFKEFWVISIDDAEHMDDESWKLLFILLDLNLVLVVATMGIQKEITPLVLRILKSPKIKTIELKGIDKWYHVGLACQMLDIDGIPPELEKIIQLKCNGNPGWIESFLVSLVQSNGVHIHEITRIAAYNTGVSVPPPYMLMRLSEEEKKMWVDIMEERRFFENEDRIATRWKMFLDSSRESYPHFRLAEHYADKLAEESLITVCTLNSEFSYENIEPELHIDVVILKTFDALTSYEQLLLKCSSILGDVFPRNMLLYIMASSAARLTALAVKKLFEIQVLTCARGNFIEGELNFKDRLEDPSDDMTVRCECRGLIISNPCEDLPKYASCGYLRFRSTEFRETTYNLLTENQKRELHERAIRYLEKGTRRCRACGNGYFMSQKGQSRFDDIFKLSDATRGSSKKTDRSSNSEASSIYEEIGKAKLIQKSSYLGRASQVTKDSDRRNTLPSYMRRPSSYGTLRDTFSSQGSDSNLIPAYNLGIIAINKLKNNFGLTKTFSNSDFTECTCLQILSTMYIQLIQHCKGAGLFEKMLTAIIEYSYVCLDCENAPQAKKVLEEALSLLEGPMKGMIELDWMVLLKKAKLYALLGNARMTLGEDECYKYIMTSLKFYGLKFPATNLARQIMKSRYKLQHTLKMYSYSRQTQKHTDDDVIDYCNNVSECLTFLCIYFTIKEKWKEAELTALWSLNKALATETDFEKLCYAYANLIKIESILLQHRFCVALEVFALKMCHIKKSMVELEELKAVSYLYLSISRGRLLRAELEKCLHIGYIIWRLASSSHCNDLIFHMLPVLTYLMVLKKQITEYGHLLGEIIYLSDSDLDNSERTWYYALCVVLHLETGYINEQISTCVTYAQSEAMDSSDRDRTGKYRLIIALWLWEVRNEKWEAAIIWQKMAWSLVLKDVGESIQNLISGLYLLEGLIIYMVSKMDRKNLYASNEADRLITALFRKLNKCRKYCKILSPRLYHLKGYYLIAKYDNYKVGNKILKQAFDIAVQQGNEIEVSWINHSRAAWCYRLPKEGRNMWREHCDPETAIHFHDLELLDKCIHYTLPLPSFI